MGNRVSRAAIFDILNTLQVPGTNTNLVAMKAVKGMDVDQERVVLDLHLMHPLRPQEEAIRQALSERLQQAGAEHLELRIQWEEPLQPETRDLLPKVKRCVVVGSGKGGVGKSTVSANLACAAARLGLKVGLLDSDILGPSLGMMFGIKDGPEGTPEGKIIPVEKFGVKLMSMGFLIDDDRPVIWRGPMLNKALEQFLGDVLWGDLDILFIDLPPGTGDIQISLVHYAKDTIQRGGAVVVSTPQDVAFLDAKKAIGLFKTVEIPVVGVIENMSSFLCPSCKTETHIFGHGGVKEAARKMELPFLGEIPIDLGLRKGSDEGTPLVVSHPDSPQSKGFLDMAKQLRDALEL